MLFRRSVILSTLFVLLAWCGSAAAENNPKVRLETTLGDITLELYAQQAPATVKNFLRYVNEGFYEGTIFHRVIPGFMVQGGGFTPAMEQKPTHAPIRNEASPQLPNQRGTIAMARTRNPHSATAQFFINVVDNPALNPGQRGPGYAVFGRVIDGMEIVDRISQVQTQRRGPYRDVPTETVEIVSATQVQD